MHNLDDIHERIALHLTQAQDRQRDAQAVLTAIAAIEGRARTAEGIAASVDHRGVLTGLALSEASLRLSWDDLGTSILGAVATAIADVQDQARPLQAQLMGDPRPLEAQTDTLDELDRLVRGTSDQSGM